MRFFYPLRRRGTKRKDDNFYLHVFFYSLYLTLAPSHLISLFARASNSGGIVTPIFFAVFRLITSSNFVGCSTGRSAGLAPFSILST
jgi:hypothetical protein